MFRKLLSFMITGLALLLPACQATSSNDAASAAQTYLQALVDRDQNRVINLSCASWEAEARLEYQSFEAVQSTLEDVSCQVSGEADSYTLVQCSGFIQANYGAEVLRLELAQRTFQLIQEAGQWRMCGYR